MPRAQGTAAFSIWLQDGILGCGGHRPLLVPRSALLPLKLPNITTTFGSPGWL